MRSLSPAEQRELQNRMEKKQMKEFMNVSAAPKYATDRERATYEQWP